MLGEKVQELVLNKKVSGRRIQGNSRRKRALSIVGGREEKMFRRRKQNALNTCAKEFRFIDKRREDVIVVCISLHLRTKGMVLINTTPK